jgi:hypothetical protein
MHQSTSRVTTLISERPMCLACIAHQTGLKRQAVDSALTVMERALRVHRTSRVCERCGVPSTIYFVKRPDGVLD